MLSTRSNSSTGPPVCPSISVWLAAGLLTAALASAQVTGTPGTQAKPVPRTVAAELAWLDGQAPPVTTLSARYRLESTSIVEGVESTFTEGGRLFFDQGDLAVYRELTASFDDMQMLYENGELTRYFPVAGYGHRVVAGSHDKERTDFSRYWRPWLAHLEPSTTIGKTAGVGQVESLSASASQLSYRPNHAAELAALPSSDLLEYWGPRPEVSFVTNTDGRVVRVERTLYGLSKLSITPQAEVRAHTVTRLESPIVFSGALIPTRIEYEATLEGQVAPYRVVSVELLDVAVEVDLPANAFTPVWPSDAFLLDVEPREPAAYLPTSDQAASQIRLADAYLGRGLEVEAAQWIETFLARFKDRTPTPSEAGQAGRLLAVAGRKDEARTLHLDAIRAARKAVAAGSMAESELVRYLGEYAYFLAYQAGREMHDEAGRFLEGKLGELSAPMAIAELAGRASHHYALDDEFTLAFDVLTRARQAVAGDAGALAWLDACAVRAETRQRQQGQMKRVWEKRRKIRDLEARLRELADLKLSTPGSEAEKARLEAELAELEARP